ncbi:hypothetical protein KM043_009557 [Ampulex compressa]|nr:hypothetical protein KM043_009557 [Ampulex compressa]
MSGVRKKINHSSVFKPRTKDEDDAELSEAVVLLARKTGQLNLSSKGLFTVPKRIWSINELTEDELQKLHYELDYESAEQRWWEQESLKVLDLSSNSLTVIDSKIEYLADLKVLHLQNNLLEKLPSEVGTLRKLEKLNLSNNKLESLCPQFYNLTELQELNLKYNAIKDIDPRIGDLIMLCHLDLSYNSLTELPIGMGYMVRLLSLDVSHNMLTELPPDITNMRVLQTLDASFNQLEVIPPMGELRKVETVMLQTNKLTTFPDMSGCVLLKVLHLADNKIAEFDMSCLGGVYQLKTLTLGNNQIKTISEEIIQLLNLEILDLSHNDISVIPHCIGVMPNLKQFLVEGNNIKNVRADIIRCGTFRILKHIRESLKSTNMTTKECLVPSVSTNNYPDKYVMKSTRLLSLAGQNIVDIPLEVMENASTADVTTVDLSRNKLSALPNQLSAVTTVTDLKLASNHLMHIPEWIGELYTHLQVLDLSKNCLHSLPSSMSLLKHLREINISFNRYAELPESIYEVTRLEILIANDNAITNIDVINLQKLKNLATLNLANNDIGFVPPELGNLKNLRTLSLSGNCFKHPRQAILVKSTEEILAYLRNLIPHEK